MKHQEWLTINYMLPKEPSRVRVSIWRKLKKSGAVILSQSVWVLPMSKDNEVFMEDISNEILKNGGEAYLMKMAPHDEGTSERIIATFDRARDEEYREFLEQCDYLLHELEKESERRKFTFAELEENETELQKLVDWYQKITQRDFHGASLRSSVDGKLEECRARLDVFIAEVYRQNDESLNSEGKP